MENFQTLFMRLFAIFYFIVITHSGFSQNEKIDSLWNVYNKAKHDTDKINILINGIAYEYENINPDTAIIYYQKANELSQDLIESSNFEDTEIKRLKSKCALCLRYIAHLQYTLNNFNQAEKNYNLAINYFTEIGDSGRIAQCYNGLGIIFDMQNNYEKALEYYHKSIKIAENVSDKRTMSVCYTNIGIIHRNIGQYEKAIQYYNQALKIAEEINNKNGVAACYGNLGVVYHDIKDDAKSKECYLKALKIVEELGDKYGISFCLMSLGNISLDATNYSEAIDYYLKSIEIKKELNDDDGISILYGNIGDTYTRQSKYNEAIEYYEKGLEISKKYGFLDNQLFVYENMTVTYEKMGNFTKALEYHKLYYKMNDSIFNKEKSKQLTEMETKYQTEKTQQEIEKQNLELGKQNAEIQKQTILRNSFIASFVLILIIALVIYRNFRNKKKANIILSQQKVEIQQQKEEIESQRDELQSSNLKLETLNSELEKLSIVASETDNSVVIADKSGEIEWVNEGFTRLFGYTKEEFISINSSNLKKASNNKDIENAIKECINEQKTVTYTTLNITKSGKSIWTQTTLTPIIKDNSLIKLVAIDSDISKLKQAEEEIKQQKEELQSQSELLIQTNGQLELKNTQITDSIRYAKQIQDAMLPDLSPKPQDPSIKPKVLEFGALNFEFETFILFRPKDIVSGDFYWFTKTEEYTFIAVADCTGHGVPGAFMSMIGNTLLNEIVAQKKIHNLEKILQKLDEGVNFAINKQQNSEATQEDGMEISICRIDFNKNEIQIASTNQSVYIINNNEFIEIEGGIYSIGGGSFSNKTFETHKIKYSENAIIYLLSDGYQDQFGGENRKKFGSSNLKELLKSISEKSLAEQKTELENTLISWKGNNKQIDDITVIGIKIYT